jgi:hypothetical protein
VIHAKKPKTWKTAQDNGPQDCNAQGRSAKDRDPQNVGP